jgi:uncharacterized protein YdhG (YjbR/CyaY superfamily)
VGNQDKFNEMKNKLSANAGDMRDRAEELYNKAKASPAGDKMDGIADNVKEKTRDAVGRMKRDKRG